MRLSRHAWFVRVALLAVSVSSITPTIQAQSGRRPPQGSQPPPANQIAFSRDSKRVAVAKVEMGLVEIWDAETGELKRTLAGHGGRITSLAFSPDGELLLTACREPYDIKPDIRLKREPAGVIKLWDVQTGELKYSLKAHNDLVSSVAFSLDGTTLVTSGRSSFVGLSAPNDAGFGAGSPTQGPGPMPRSSIRRFRQSYAELKFWDIAKRKETRSIQWYGATAGPITISPDGKTVAVRKIESGAEVRLLDVQTGKTNHSVKAKGEDNSRASISGFVFSPDGRTLAVVIALFKLRTTSRVINRVELQASKVELWDVQKGKRRAVLGAYESPVRSLAFTPDGNALLVWSGENSFNITDVHTGQSRRIDNQAGRARVVAFSPDGRTFAAGRDDNTVTLSDSRTGETRQTLVGSTEPVRTMAAGSFVVSVEGVLSIAFSADSKTMVSAGNDKTIEVWDALAAMEKQRLTGHSGAVLSVAISPDGDTLVSGGRDSNVKLWDTKSGVLKRTLAGHGAPVNSVVFSHDGGTVASASDDGTVKLWNAASGEVMREISDLDGPVKSIAFSPDGNTMAGGVNEAVMLWEAKAGKTIRVFRGHTGSIKSVAFSPDGATLASASSDETVRLWSVRKGELKLTLAKHNAAVNAVAFAPDGKSLASGSDDRTVNMWDAETGRLQRSLKGHEIAVYSVAFSPDGRVLVSGSGNNGLIFWDAHTGELKQIVRRLNAAPRTQ